MNSSLALDRYHPHLISVLTIGGDRSQVLGGSVPIKSALQFLTMQQFSIGGGGRDAGGGWGPLNYEKAELLSHGYALRLWARILGVAVAVLFVI